MIELNLNKIYKNFGARELLKGFNLELKTGEKVALIGPNGSGKTTIFKMIMDLVPRDSGDIFIRKGATLGMLSQMPSEYSYTTTVENVIRKSKEKVFKLDKEIEEITMKLGEAKQDEVEKLLSLYARKQEEYEKLDGYQTESEIKKVCSGFKIDDNMLKREFNTLSGGEKTIVSFAALILENPTILLLDEPTNHLDISTLEWLESYLKSYKGSILISSHDRYFLDRVTEKTVLIDRGKDEVFFGNYSYYLKENERRILAEFESYKDQQKKIAAMKASIKKLQEFGHLAFPNGEQFFKRVASIQKRLDKMELLDKPEEAKELPLEFKMLKRSGTDVVTIRRLTLSVGEKRLLYHADMDIKFKDRVALMGKNGTGKSTLIKMLLGQNNAKIEYGDIKLGASITIGYLPQEIHFEDENLSVFDTVRKFYEGTESIIRAVLSKFLFFDDMIYKKINMLSGGEKVRLKLLELLQTKANFLILDEPTNHIDIDTREVLEESLKNYAGTVLFVSHDRYFVNKLANKVVEIENQKINEYIGNYDDFKIQKGNG